MQTISTQISHRPSSPTWTQSLTPSPQLPDVLPTLPRQACWGGSMLFYANFGSMQIAYGMQINALNN